MPIPKITIETGSTEIPVEERIEQVVKNFIQSYSKVTPDLKFDHISQNGFSVRLNSGYANGDFTMGWHAFLFWIDQNDDIGYTQLSEERGTIVQISNEELLLKRLS